MSYSPQEMTFPIVQHSLIHPFGLMSVNLFESVRFNALSEYKSPRFNWLYEFADRSGNSKGIKVVLGNLFNSPVRWTFTNESVPL